MRGKDIRIRMDVSDCQDRQSPSPLSDENETDEHEQNLRKYGGTVPFPRELLIWSGFDYHFLEEFASFKDLFRSRP